MVRTFPIRRSSVWGVDIVRVITRWTSRALKVGCLQPGCGYQVRITRRWLKLGTPRCPVVGHGIMELMEAGGGGQLRLLDGSATWATPAISFVAGVGEPEAQ